MIVWHVDEKKVNSRSIDFWTHFGDEFLLFSLLSLSLFFLFLLFLVLTLLFLLKRMVAWTITLMAGSRVQLFSRRSSKWLLHTLVVPRLLLLYSSNSQSFWPFIRLAVFLVNICNPRQMDVSIFFVIPFSWELYEINFWIWLHTILSTYKLPFPWVLLITCLLKTIQLSRSTRRVEKQ